MGYYYVVKRDELTGHENKCMNLKWTFKSKRSQSEKATYSVTVILWHFGKGKTKETVKSIIKKNMVPGEWRHTVE